MVAQFHFGWSEASLAICYKIAPRSCPVLRHGGVMKQIARILSDGVHLTILIAIIVGLATGAIFAIRFALEQAIGRTSDLWWIIPSALAYFYSMGIVSNIPRGQNGQPPASE